jgi:hypothetical protein
VVIRGLALLTSLVLALSVSAPTAEPHGQDFYAAPQGRPDGDGSLDHPWDLQTALNRQPAVQPGATIWVRGGAYTGSFISRVSGQEGAYVTIRAYGKERPILDNAGGGAPQASPLTVQGSYVVIWGLEVTSSNPNRKTDTDAIPEEDFRSTGISVLAPHTRLVNNIVHDTGNCIGHWSTATDSEVYGNVLFFCGWDGPTRGHGHGLYIQNTGGTKEVRNNVIFSPFGYGIHAFTSGGEIDDLHFRRNVVFQSSRLPATNPEWAGGDILVGGRKVAYRSVVEGNFTYTPRGTNHLGYIAGTQNAVVRGNYFVQDGNGTALTVLLPRNLEMAGNTFVGEVTDAGRYRDNRFERAPHGTWQFALPNAYDAARATLVIYNWDKADAVAVDVGSLLTAGDIYQIRSVENYFADAASRTYTGGPVLVSMTPSAVAAPVGWHAPPTSLPTFGVFVVIKDASPRS